MKEKHNLPATLPDLTNFQAVTNWLENLDNPKKNRRFFSSNIFKVVSNALDYWIGENSAIAAALAAVVADGDTKSVIGLSSVSLVLSFLSLTISTGWPGVVGLVSLPLLLTIGIVVFLVKTSKTTKSSKLYTPEQIQSRVVQYVRDLINNKKQEVIAADSSYTKHIHKLEARKEETNSSLNYWSVRSQSDPSEFVSVQLKNAQRLVAKSTEELQGFLVSRQDILDKLNSFDRMVPVIETEVRDYYESERLESLDAALAGLRLESANIISRTFTSLSFELAELHELIQRLRLRALPTANTANLGQIADRVDGIIATADQVNQTMLITLPD